MSCVRCVVLLCVLCCCVCCVVCVVCVVLCCSLVHLSLALTSLPPPLPPPSSLLPPPPVPTSQQSKAHPGTKARRDASQALLPTLSAGALRPVPLRAMDCATGRRPSVHHQCSVHTAPLLLLLFLLLLLLLLLPLLPLLLLTLTLSGMAPPPRSKGQRAETSLSRTAAERGGWRWAGSGSWRGRRGGV